MKTKVRTMQQERDPLNLSSLPPLAPPGDDWPAIKTALLAHQNRRRLWKAAGGTLAAAASIALAAGLILNQSASMHVNEPALTQAHSTQPIRPAAVETEKGDVVASLINLSQRLETSLQHIRSGVGVMPTASLIYQVELEDMVAQVDEELSMNPASTTLWSQRVNLLLDLSQLYKNELRRESHRMASL